MLNGIRSRLSYANVMATGAMFLALGGGAYALSGVPDRSGVFHGCVATSGALRVVTKASSCRKAKTVKRGAAPWLLYGLQKFDGRAAPLTCPCAPVSRAG